MTDKSNPIAHAARLLREAAQELQQGHTLGTSPNDWTGEPEAKAAYDEHMGAATALEALAASAGSEPVASEGAWDNLKQMMMWSAFGGVLQLDDALANIDEFAGLHPSPPEGMAGWKLVPIDPTLDMGWAYLDAARESEPLRTHSFNHAGYRAMIAAAPPLPASEAKEL